MEWLRHLFRSNPQPIPPALWADCLARLQCLKVLPEDDQRRLRTLCETLLHRTPFTGAAGFSMTDEIAVAIAAQACLPVLNLTLALYDDMAGVIVYPSQFIIPQTEVDEAGVVHEWHEPVSGEAIDAGGAVVLSWEDVDDVDSPGYNVVIHEFAHKIDMRNGDANGRPPFLAGLHDALDAADWHRTFRAAYRDFCARATACEAQLPKDFDTHHPEHLALANELFGQLPLDPYAAHHPAEFFAVASEGFFLAPEPLQEDYPGVYDLLKKYYRLDPLALWLAARESGGGHS